MCRLVELSPIKRHKCPFLISKVEFFHFLETSRILPILAGNGVEKQFFKTNPVYNHLRAKGIGEIQQFQTHPIDYWRSAGSQTCLVH